MFYISPLIPITLLLQVDFKSYLELWKPTV